MSDTHIMILDCCSRIAAERNWNGQPFEHHELRIAIEQKHLSRSAPMLLPCSDDIKDAVIGIMRDADEWVIGALASGLHNTRHADITVRGLQEVFDSVEILADRWIDGKHLDLRDPDERR